MKGDTTMYLVGHRLVIVPALVQEEKVTHWLASKEFLLFQPVRSEAFSHSIGSCRLFYLQAPGAPILFSVCL